MTTPREEFFEFLIMFLFLILAVGYSSCAHAATEEYCWQSCRMTMDAGIAACGIPQCGSEKDMLSAEKAARIERELFTREWSKSGKWGLDWKNGGNALLMNGGGK